MSRNHELLSIEESARLAAVSKDTVIQYQALGLLRAVTELENTLLFAEDIRAVFGISEAKRVEETVLEANSSPSSLQSPLTLAPANDGNQTRLTKTSPLVNRRYHRPRRIKDLENKISSLNARCRALESRLQTVNEERDWLRSRVERLELRSEREQMLLLAQQQQSQQLLAERDSQRSFWQFALPWLNRK